MIQIMIPSYDTGREGPGSIDKKYSHLNFNTYLTVLLPFKLGKDRQSAHCQPSVTSICNSAMSEVDTFLGYTCWILHTQNSDSHWEVTEEGWVIVILSLRLITRNFILNDGITLQLAFGNWIKLFSDFPCFPQSEYSAWVLPSCQSQLKDKGW